MKTPRSTKAEQSAAEQGKRDFTGTELLGVVRFQTDKPMPTPYAGAGRGTIPTKPKGPVCRNTFGQAVATPTDKRGFVTPKFSGLVRLHRSRMVSGCGGGYPQGRPHGLSRVTNRHTHPLPVVGQPVVLKSRQGATMSHPATSASVRVTTPTTGTTTSEQQAFALLQAASDATMAAFYVRKGNIPAARRKAVQLLKALQGLSKFERAQVTTPPCTGCRDNFPLPKAVDFFDTQVVAEYVTRRTACTRCPAAQKPCLKGGAV